MDSSRGEEETRPDEEWTDSQCLSKRNMMTLPEADRQMLEGLYLQVSRARERMDNYLYLISFFLFVVVYAFILHLQADAEPAFRLTTAHANLLLPSSYAANLPLTFPNAPTDIYDWLNTSIVQNVWADPPCGDGVCSSPAEYPAFGRFGCSIDCGTFENVTTILITISYSFISDLERSSSSWNLIMTSPLSLQWFAEDQMFADLVFLNNETKVQVPDGKWQLILNAPYGGVKGQIYNFVNSTNSEFLQQDYATSAESQLMQFGGCLEDQGSFGKCLQFSAAIASYVAGSCPNGTLDSNTKAQLYLDWSQLCTTHPGFISNLVNESGHYNQTKVYFDTLTREKFETGSTKFLPCSPASPPSPSPSPSSSPSPSPLPTDYFYYLAESSELH
eukprot:TRINITY_DN9019_c0_g1_i11.p1 TRINITY_DN9019_c0_g1~~TRINITY_DN9019_c0_g1_i11.p1  ORF type:complete len:389 (+),score=30.12 TRINITY_DN9019_c0_g1_i11:111-1277(+)